MSGQTLNQEFERKFGGNAADVFTTTTLERTALCIEKLPIKNKNPVIPQPPHSPDVSQRTSFSRNWKLGTQVQRCESVEGIIKKKKKRKANTCFFKIKLGMLTNMESLESY
jgi:hypothetical protein